MAWLQAAAAPGAGGLPLGSGALRRVVAVLMACGSPGVAGIGQLADWSAWAQALLLEADGELADALETLSGCWDRCATSGLAVEYPVIGPDLVRLALAAEDAGRARDVAAAVVGVASRNEVPWIAGAALRCQGLAENDADVLQAAVDAYARGSRPLELALTCEDAGAAFARRGNTARVGQLLDQTITIFERLDAARDLARAEAALRQMGVRRGRRVTHSRACPAGPVRLSRDLPGSAPVSAPMAGALTDRDISQLTDACPAGAAACWRRGLGRHTNPDPCWRSPCA